ncbi:siphovirus Gp157 family protein [Aestuariivirga sp.]|uniref:siphovirus Gp157 family protein n=1 Tax=Aestuariivirga sp. TaxID=2650926 RepID=UPI0035940265
MHNTSTIATELNRFHELRRRLLAQDPEIDDTTLADTLEGIASLHEAVTAVIRSALEDEAMACGLRGRMDELESRLSRIEERAHKKRELALSVMGEARIEKITAPDVTISLRPAPPAVEITDEALIPEWFWVPQGPKLDRRRILEVLKAGDAVLGTSLSTPRVCLSVRTK